MCGTANHTIDVRLLNVEVDIQSIHALKVVAFAKNIVNHLNICISFLLIFSCIPTDLNSC